MAKKTSRKLSLKKETLRTLTEEQLRGAAGAGLSGAYCTAGCAGGGSYTCISETLDCTTVKDGGDIIIVSR
jgi:hypothetical protein